MWRNRARNELEQKYELGILVASVIFGNVGLLNAQTTSVAIYSLCRESDADSSELKTVEDHINTYKYN